MTTKFAASKKIARDAKVHTVPGYVHCFVFESNAICLVIWDLLPTTLRW